jgi:hypothetical protein
MAVAHVATGADVHGTTNTPAMDSPSGDIGDLLIAVVMHDDHSDGAISNTDGALTWTTIYDNATRLGDDIRSLIVWAIEDQEAARTFNWTFTTAEQWGAIILRYSGVYADVPIQVDSLETRTMETVKTLTVTNPGSMGFFFCLSDSFVESLDGDGPKTGWTERESHYVDQQAMFLMDRAYGLDDYPYPITESQIGYVGKTADNSTSEGSRHCGAFVIAPPASTATISGVTKDKDGSALGSCETYLMKENAAGDEVMFVAKTTSHVSTGAYSFTVVNDTDALFFVYSFKDDSPHVFDVTDHVLTPS